MKKEKWPHRVIIEVMPSLNPNRWLVGARRLPPLMIQRTSLWRNKKDAIARGRRLSHEWYDKGYLVQLVVRKRNGQIQFENTYGKDPERTKG